MSDLAGGLIGAGSAVVLGGGAWLTFALRQYLYKASAMPAEEIQPVALDKYKVLERLASPQDVQFLRTMPGFTPEMETRFLRERRQAFRAYLREMAADFQRIHRAAKQLAAVAPQEHSDLVGKLFRQQVAFWRSLAAIEIQLAFHWAGVPSIDLSELMRSFESVRVAAPAAA